MSWIPFWKQSKKVSIETVSDNAFDKNVEKYNKVEANTRKLYKDTKRYIEDNSSLIKSEQRFGQEMVTSSSSYAESDPSIVVVTENIQQSLNKQADLQNELNSNVRRGMYEPLKKFSANFNSVNNAIKRREQSLQDYSKYLNRREKFLEKEGQPQSGKYDANERYLALAKADFERRNVKLLMELPKFFENRKMYFEPCFETLIKSQYFYYKNSRDIYEELSVNVDCPTEQWSQEMYEEETKAKLNEIRALSIVADR